MSRGDEPMAQPGPRSFKVNDGLSSEPEDMIVEVNEPGVIGPNERGPSEPGDNRGDSSPRLWFLVDSKEKYDSGVAILTL